MRSRLWFGEHHEQSQQAERQPCQPDRPHAGHDIHPLSAEDARAFILRSRAASEGEVSLAAAINAAALGSRLQPQEDAFTLPSEEPVCQPVGKV